MFFEKDWWLYQLNFNWKDANNMFVKHVVEQVLWKENANTNCMDLALSKPKLGKLLYQSLNPLVFSFGLIILQYLTLLIDEAIVLNALD